MSACVDPDYPHTFPLVLTEPVIFDGLNQPVFSPQIQNPDAPQTILSHGFVFGQSAKPTMSSTVLSADAIHNGKFSVVVSRPLLVETPYFVRSFVKIEGATLYGNEVQFISASNGRPVITDFFPKSGSQGTEILIVGKNFSPVAGENIVKIGTLQCEVIDAFATNLSVSVPPYTQGGEFNITVTTNGHPTSSHLLFTLE